MTPATTSAAITARLSFTVPPARSASSAQRRAQYISPSSQSLQIVVAYGTATTLGTAFNLVPLPDFCAQTNGQTSCNVSVVAQASATAFIISFYDQPNEQGNLLSTATVPVPVAVNGVATIDATLLPVAANIALAPITLISGQAGSAMLSFTAEDADGNPISGTAPFSAPIVLTPSSSAFTFTPNTLISPATVVTVTYTGASGTNNQIVAQTGTSTFTAQLPFASVTSPAPTASPTVAPTASPSPNPGVLTITPGDVGVTVGGPSAAITVTPSSVSTYPVALVASCTAGASIALTPTSVPPGAAATVMVTALTAPSSTVTHACTVTGTEGSLSASIYVDVNANQATIMSHNRRLP